MKSRFEGKIGRKGNEIRTELNWYEIILVHWLWMGREAQICLSIGNWHKRDTKWWMIINIIIRNLLCPYFHFFPFSFLSTSLLLLKRKPRHFVDLSWMPIGWREIHQMCVIDYIYKGLWCSQYTTCGGEERNRISKGIHSNKKDSWTVINSDVVVTWMEVKVIDWTVIRNR